MDPELPEPSNEDGPSPFLLWALRLGLVVLVVFVAAVIAGWILVSVLGLHGGGGGNSPIRAGVPVDPPTQSSPSAPSPTTDIGDSSDYTPPPSPTGVPQIAEMPPGLAFKIEPASVGSGQSFRVSGTYEGRDGVPLTLQRMENGVWADYPNEILVTMGTFSTTASSTLPGVNSFRVYDQSLNRASNVVTLLVR